MFSDVVSQGIEIGRQQIIKTIEGRIEFLEQEQSERKARGVNLRYANHTRTCNILREFVKDLKRIYDCSTPKEVSEG